MSPRPWGVVLYRTEDIDKPLYPYQHTCPRCSDLCDPNSTVCVECGCRLTVAQDPAAAVVYLEGAPPASDVRPARRDRADGLRGARGQG
jgi:hypothetical protein